jgi:hypothetical protein
MGSRSTGIARKERIVVSAPKGQQSSAQGFNPGLAVPKRCALKVAPEDDRREFWRTILTKRHQSGATFRARRVLIPNPGLKPWAEFFCPFGAEIKWFPMRLEFTILLTFLAEFRF